MLQPGDQYGFDPAKKHQTHTEVRTSMAIIPSQNNMGVAQHPPRHTKLYSELHGNNFGNLERHPDNNDDLYGFNRG